MGTADLPVSLFVHGTECIAEVKVMQSGMILLETLYLRIKPLWLHMAPVCLRHGPSPNCLKFDSPACLLLATVNRIALGMQQTPMTCDAYMRKPQSCLHGFLSLSLCVCVSAHVCLRACVSACMCVCDIVCLYIHGKSLVAVIKLSELGIYK